MHFLGITLNTCEEMSKKPVEALGLKHFGLALNRGFGFDSQEAKSAT